MITVNEDLMQSMTVPVVTVIPKLGKYIEIYLRIFGTTKSVKSKNPIAAIERLIRNCFLMNFFILGFVLELFNIFIFFTINLTKKYVVIRKAQKPQNTPSPKWYELYTLPTTVSIVQ